jgi:hypothetical protein
VIDPQETAVRRELRKLMVAGIGLAGMGLVIGATVMDVVLGNHPLALGVGAIGGVTMLACAVVNSRLVRRKSTLSRYYEE